MSSIIVSSKSGFGKANVQHVIDLDTAVFTCNWCYGYAWDKNEGVQDHFIRGIILPGKKNLFENDKALHNSSREILVKDLPEEDQKKIYALYDDAMLDNVWRMILDTNDRYVPTWLPPDLFWSVTRQYLSDRKCPLMLIENFHVALHGYGHRCNAPIIIQPNAIIGGSLKDWKLRLCTTYGKCNFDLMKLHCWNPKLKVFYQKASMLDQVLVLESVSNRSTD